MMIKLSSRRSGRDKSVYQYAWFIRYMTHVMTTRLLVEGSPLRYLKMLEKKGLAVQLSGCSLHPARIG